MNTLILKLPSPGSPVEFDYVLTADSHTATRHGRISAALLPTLSSVAGEVLAVVPVQAVSWHRVEFPKGVLERPVFARGSANPRLRSVLEGLLEEQLLDEPAQLHFALAPRQQAGHPGWVAVCDRQWLASVLELLETAQIALSRVVPEFLPQPANHSSSVHVIQGSGTPLLVVAGAQGVSALPLSATAVALLAGSDSQTVFAEPAASAEAEQVFKRPVELLPLAQRCLQASRSDWNLAQFEFVRTGQDRWLKKLGLAWNSFRAAPEWRVARWSALALLVIQLLGLTGWVWSEQSALAAKRSAIRNTLLQTFPEVRVVLDAPLQMEREVQALQQGAGAAAPQDLEAMLVALSDATSTDQSLSAIEFRDGETRVKGLQLSPEETSRVTQKLSAQGYLVQPQGEQWLIRTERQR